jgi:PAS domain S-box-containing protein
VNPYSAASLFSAIAMAFLGMFVHFRNTKSTLNRVFMVLALTTSYWAFTEFQIRNSESAERASFWVTASYVWPLALAFLLHFSLTFTERAQSRGWRLWLWFIYAPAAVFAILNVLVYSPDVYRVYWGWAPNYRSSWSEAAYMVVSYVWAFSLAVLSLVLCIRYAWTAQTQRTRKMGKHVSIGLAFVIVPAVLTELILPAVYERPVIPLTVSSCAIMAAFVTYAIIKYELFTLDPVSAAESIVATISDPLFLVDLDHSIRTTNAAACHMLGYELHELLGHPISKIFPPSTDGESNTGFMHMLETGVVNDVETALVTKQGRSIPVSLSWSMTRSKDGRVLGITFVGRDITERLRFQEGLKQARDELQNRVEEQTRELTVANKLLRDEIAERMKVEEQLANDKEYLTVTLRSIADGVIVTDSEGRITLRNRVAEELTGCSPDEMLGQPLCDVFRVIDEKTRTSIGDPFQAVVDKGEAVSLGEGVLLIAKDGTERLISDSGAPIQYHSGNARGVVIVFRDISERRRLEERLLKTRKLESVSVLAAGLAHDFNNILTGIMTSLFVARTQVKPESETYQLLSEAEQSAFRASTLTKQLLTFSKSTTPVRQRTSLRELVEETAGYCLSGSHVDYELQLDDDLYDVELDRGQMDQALSNIVINAEEAMPGGGSIRIQARNRSIRADDGLPLRDGEFVVVSVIDQGSGIAEENLHRIFDPYFTTKEEHNGLGLTTAYAIVTKHEGCVDVESRVGQGSTVYVYLPAAQPEEHFEGPELDDETGGVVIEPRRVLFMDDEDYLRRTAKKLLEHLGYEAVIVSEGEEAVGVYERALADGKPFDAIILDLVVSSGLGAKDTLSRIRQLDPDVRAIVTSGFSSDPVMQNCNKHGFSGSLTKPYVAGEIAKALEKVLEEDEPSAR